MNVFIEDTYAILLLSNSVWKSNFPSNLITDCVNLGSNNLYKAFTITGTVVLAEPLQNLFYFSQTGRVSNWKMLFIV